MMVDTPDISEVIHDNLRQIVKAMQDNAVDMITCDYQGEDNNVTATIKSDDPNYLTDILTTVTAISTEIVAVNQEKQIYGLQYRYGEPTAVPLRDAIERFVLDYVRDRLGDWCEDESTFGSGDIVIDDMNPIAWHHSEVPQISLDLDDDD